MFSYGAKFTPRAANAIKAAQEIAAELGHSQVASEHILLGLLREDGCIAASALGQLGVDYDSIREAVIEAMGEGQSGAPVQSFTPRGERIIQIAAGEAARRGQSFIGTEHLLMGILRESDSVAAQLLSRAGVDANELYRTLANMAGSSADTPPSGEEQSSGGARQPSSRQNHGGATKTLDKFGRDLTDMARSGALDPIIGRDEETARVIRILSRRTKNNPVLIGEPGVGKTAVAEGLAERIAAGDVPETLKNKRLFSLDLGGMLAGTKYRGEFEERIKGAIDDVKNAGNIILFIDEIHTLIGAGAAEGAIDAANILKPALSRGEIQMIGATTLDEYRKHIEKDAALERRFQPVTVGEPTEAEAVEILKGLREKYEQHHKLTIPDSAIVAAVELSARYIGDRRLPDKAIDLIDEACSRVRMDSNTAPTNIKDLENELKKIAADKEKAVAEQDFERAASLRDEEKRKQSELDTLRTEWKGASAATRGEVTEDDVAAVVAGWTGVPVTRLTESEAQRLLHMEDILHKRVIGQDEAVSAVSRAIRRGRVGLKDPKRPTGSFIFLGPTGVGKTELCRALAEALFGDENAMIRVDMSEFMEKHSVSKLIGSPPGYVGFDEGGQLTEKVRRRPYSVLLFDEIEKAHPDVFNLLLQILEDGRLTDSQGRVVDFKNTIIVMTSNLGAHDLLERKRLGFGEATDDTPSDDEMRETVMQKLKEAFRPEFLNRIDEIIVFKRLDKPTIREIARSMFDTVAARIKDAGNVTLTADDSALDLIADEGFDPTYGARPLRRAISSKVEDAVAERLLDGSLKAGDVVVATAKDGVISFDKQ